MDEKLKEAYDELIMYKIHSIFAFSVFDDHEMIGLISIHNPDAAKQRKELTFTQYLMIMQINMQRCLNIGEKHKTEHELIDKDGKEAVEIFKKSKEHSYDLILMDKIVQYC